MNRVGASSSVCRRGVQTILRDHLALTYDKDRQVLFWAAPVYICPFIIPSTISTLEVMANAGTSDR
jgi:hypothetical protein